MDFVLVAALARAIPSADPAIRDLTGTNPCTSTGAVKTPGTASFSWDDSIFLLRRFLLT